MQFWLCALTLGTVAQAVQAAEPAGTSGGFTFGSDSAPSGQASADAAATPAPSADATPTAGATTDAPAAADMPADEGKHEHSAGMADGEHACPYCRVEMQKPWMQRFVPTGKRFEIGLFTGLVFPSSDHNFKVPESQHQGINAAPELGFRIGLYPLKYVGAEAEAMVAFGSTADKIQAYPWAGRASLVAQAPVSRLVPFALVGIGRMGVVSNRLGNDGDPAIHFGLGVKAAVNPMASVRVEIRDNMTQKHDAADGTMAHSPEFLLGMSLTLGHRPMPMRHPPMDCAQDKDGDGLTDQVDRCPAVAAPGTIDGCAPTDTDGDSYLDNVDKCPREPGIAPNGCPPADADEDGIADDKDQCPKEKGEMPTGCPAATDKDGDGVLDGKDKCPDQPETKNGFEDSDGCPDVLPDRVKAFTGVIQGIEFDLRKATIRASSHAVLDKSAALLVEYPALEVIIAGHTDNTGARDTNVKLSKERAEAVKAYLVSKGVDAARIETRGAGPDEPVDSNASEPGRQRNRRIEFKLKTSN